jgi:hypothetical protein
LHQPSHRSRVTEKVSLGFPQGQVEVYRPIAGFAHPHEGYDTLGLLGENTSKLHSM